MLHFQYQYICTGSEYKTGKHKVDNREYVVVFIALLAK